MSKDKLNKLTVEDLDNLSYEELEQYYKELEKTLPYDQRIDNVDISNDFMFCHVMQDKEIFAEVLHRILPELDIGRVEFCEYQKTLSEYIDMQGVRFDVYAKTKSDGEIKVFDVEMQKVNKDSLAKRARYYHALMTSNIMNRAEIKNYKDLPDEFVIFICKFDLFGQGRSIYEFENLCRQDTNLSLGDGTRTIFVNADSSDENISPELKNFLNFIMGGTSSDPFIKKLEKIVYIAKQRPEWRINYMKMLMRDSLKLEEGIAIGERRGERRGIIKGTRLGERKANFATAKKMLSAGIKISEIMKFTDLSLEDLNSLQQA
ncbi:MAG: Rpn family recombination-promoting nuclease/putative transposase [Synergistaceae bacterium]|nr:Rpn family recombination-promoting nuclease/putative transposase [Synergistaceae bacterium]MBQ7570045.1 Rpn family recombination-promoting nuclease/putative transposase [Synergistaceae bacterium]MBQ9582359.1 Rpn family recombination-promoting nuclease/putative transposase [Synergistaceae bacterium]MBR0095570.1 Rpn family recombination-promoting nuclease/putative transposase [Synergistaceae bacterium]